jgi:hypothetical protein
MSTYVESLRRIYNLLKPESEFQYRKYFEHQSKTFSPSHAELFQEFPKVSLLSYPYSSSATSRFYLPNS